MQTSKTYDLIVIGSGPAGLAASIYASRYKLEHLLFGAENGGQMNEIHEIENWPGDVRVFGKDLIARFTAHAESYGVKICRESVGSIRKTRDVFEVETAQGKYQARVLVLAMGARYRRMNIPGEKEFTGKGVSYCATCDAMFFRDKTVCVVGGGNSAAVVALELLDFASRIYLIHREEKLAVEPVWLDRIYANPKIEVLKDNDIIEIRGGNKVEKVILEKPVDDKTFLDVDGVFIEVGTEPGVQLAQKLGVAIDEGGYIQVGVDMATNVPGVFAAGDITTGSNKFRQVLTATAEGAIAANSAYKMLKLK